MAAELETPRVTDRDRDGCRIDRAIMQRVRVIAAHEGIGVSELLERELRRPIDRRYAKVVNELGESGA